MAGEEGASVAIRTHAQEEQVESRKTFPWVETPDLGHIVNCSSRHIHTGVNGVYVFWFDTNMVVQVGLEIAMGTVLIAKRYMAFIAVEHMPVGPVWREEGRR